MANRSSLVAAFVVLLATVCLSSSAVADTDSPPSTTPAETAIVVPKGLWAFETYGSYASQPSGSREQLYSATIGAGYYFIPNNSLTLEMTGLEGTQDGPNVLSGGADLLLRTHLINKPKWSMFIDFGAGILESSGRIPETGTNFNFFFKTGVGASIHLWDRTDLLVGTRYVHISNARLDGPEHNPSINAIEGYVGLLFEF